MSPELWSALQDLMQKLELAGNAELDEFITQCIDALPSPYNRNGWLVDLVQGVAKAAVRRRSIGPVRPPEKTS